MDGFDEFAMDGWAGGDMAPWSAAADIVGLNGGDVSGFAQDLGAGSGPFAIGNIPSGLPTLIMSGSQSMPTPTPRPPIQFGSMGAMVGRVASSIAARFPLLWGAMQVWRGRGINLTVERLWTLLRRFGPQFLVTAGILSLGALTELLLAHSTRRRRRMNVLNPKALSRSVRRLAGFERRASRVSSLLASTCRVSRRPRGKSRRACAVCHHNPCTC